MSAHLSNAGIDIAAGWGRGFQHHWVWVVLHGGKAPHGRALWGDWAHTGLACPGLPCPGLQELCQCRAQCAGAACGNSSANQPVTLSRGVGGEGLRCQGCTDLHLCLNPPTHASKVHGTPLRVGHHALVRMACRSGDGFFQPDGDVPCKDNHVCRCPHLICAAVPVQPGWKGVYDSTGALVPSVVLVNA